MKFFYYGKFGGPGWTNGSYDPPGRPNTWGNGIDDLDEIFKKHDTAYWYADEAYKQTGDAREYCLELIQADKELLIDLAELPRGIGQDPDYPYPSRMDQAADYAAAAFRTMLMYRYIDYATASLPNFTIPENNGDSFTGMPWFGTISVNTNTSFTAARNLVIRYDPLILDLDGDGLELAGATGAILFDHNADGIKTGTGWAHPDDGLLVRDVNGNGAIDTGRELFGVDTIKSDGTLAANGFDALKDLDSDGDGFITGADAAFGELRVWQDANQDGISQASELKTLASLGITSIGVNGSASGPPAGQVINGNRVALSATFTRDGQTHTVGSVDLEANNFFTEFPAEVVDADGNPVAITEQAQALPQMNGSGMVRDMQTAASLSGAFADALQTFATTATRDGQRSQLDNLIAQWAATSGYWGGLLADSNAGNVTLNPPAGTTAAQYRNMINVLEAFNGSRFYGNEYGGPRPAGFTITSSVDRATGRTVYRYIVSPPAQQVALVQQAYDALRESVYVALVTQTRLKPYLDSIELTIDENGIGFDTSALAAKLESYKAVDAKEALTDLVELNRYALPTLQAVHFDGLDTLRTWVDSLAADSPLRATLASLDVLTAGVTTGTARGDIYLGGAGADSFNGGAGDDVLIGGAGNDVLNGGIGNNVYVFGRGDGQDTISGTYDTASGKSSALQFRADVAAADVAVKRSGSDLVLSIAGSTDTITVQYFFYGDSTGNVYNPLQEIRFADGTTWSAQEVARRAMLGTSSNDLLRGLVGDDVIAGGDGADTLYGAGGNDVLDGGAGNDYMQGDGGADVYRFGRGGGQDTVNNYEAVAQGAVKPTDAIEFGADVAPGDVVVTRNWYGDLILSIAGTTDSLTVRNYFQNDGATSYAVDEIRFADGTVWSVADVKARALVANEAGSTLYGFESDDAITGAAGNDVIYARGGNDTVDGNEGDDGLYGEAGDDLLRGGAGRDYLVGGDGNDILDGGADDDQLIGGEGEDTYRFGRGCGKDTLNNYDTTVAGVNPVDTIELGAGIAPADVEVRRSAWNELVLSIKGTSDVLTVSQFFVNDGASPYAVDRISFADGTVWDVATIKARVLDATAGADNFVGYASADVMNGADGNDTLSGAGGNDVLDGDAGDDVLYGDAGDDTLRGGTGNDQLTGGDGNDLLQGGSGNDALMGSQGDDVLDGGAGNDSLNGGEGDDTYLFGLGDGQDTIREQGYFANGGGNDTLRIRAGVDAGDVKISRSGNDIIVSLPCRIENGVSVVDSVRLQGVLDNDGDNEQKIEQVVFDDGTTWTLADLKIRLLTGSAANDVINGYASADTLVGQAGDDWLYGLAGADTLQGGAGDDHLDGGDGDDVLDGGAGNDVLIGGAGNNSYVLDTGSGQDVIVRNFFDGAAASDTIWVPAEIGLSNVELVREDLDVLVRIRGTQDSIRIRGVMANDGLFDNYSFRVACADGTTLEGPALRQALLNGGAGNDVLTGYASDDTMRGGAGDDVIRGEMGADQLFGDDGDDQLFGGKGADSLAGGLGNDLLDGGEGADTLAGGAGDDTYVIDDAGDVFVELPNEGTDTVISSVDVTLLDNFENGVLTGDLDLSLTGNSAANVLHGNDGANLILGEGGDDVIDGGGGADTLAGGTGDDIYFVDRSDDVIIENAGEGIDTVRATASYTLSGNVEDLVLESSGGYIDGTGNALANHLTGNEFDNRLDGGAGADTLIGGLGNEIYVVDDAGDLIVENANEGNDTVEVGFSYTLADKPNLENITLTGTANADATGNAADNVLLGNSGDNVLDGAGGNNYLAGGAGNDTYYANIEFDWQSNTGDRIVEQAGEGTDTVIRSYSTYRILEDNVENLTLAGNANYGNGNELDNVIRGNDLGDSLAGWDGNDTLIGGQGNDALFGGSGADLMIGGAGDDYYEIDDAGDVIVENAGEGDDFVRSTVSWTLGANVERLALDGADDLYATGNVQDNGLWGNDGNNILTGGGGNDYLSGGAGDDVYVFNAGDGQDTIDNTDALGATDTLRFGAGIGENDVLAFQSGEHIFFKIKGTSDQIAFLDYYGANTVSGGVTQDHKIDRIEFANGTVWNQAMIQTVVDRANNNHAPTVGSFLPTLKASQGSAFNYVVPVNTITDPDVWDSVTYSATLANGDPLPAWLSFDTQTRTFSGTPTSGDLGNLQFVLWGTDNYGYGTGIYVNLTVSPPNRSPVVATPLTDQSVAEGTALSYTIPSGSFSDPDAGDSLTYTATLTDGSALPSWLSFNAATRKFSGTVPIGATQALSVKVTATDQGGLSVQDSFDIAVVVQNLTLNGTASAETLTGRSGNDTIDGKAGNDTLIGNAGNDRLIGGTGNDTMRGGTGDDTYVVDSTSDVVTEYAGEGTDTVESGVTWTLGANVENLLLTGTSAINGTGNGLDNVLTGNNAANTLTGDAGNDVLDGKAGADTMKGGAGDDTYYVDNTSDVVTELAGEGTDTVFSSVSYTLSANVENLRINGSGALNATGNASDNILYAGAGNNVLNGQGGTDTVSYLYAGSAVTVSLASASAQATGGSGSDTLQNIENLSGSNYDDALTGSAGANVLDGGLGNDTLAGGAGNDTYLLGRGYGSDTVTENDATAGNTDVAQFGADIAADQLWFRQVGSNLEVSVIGTGDRFTINNWYSGSQYHVEQFKTSDGKVLLDSAVQNLVQAMAGFAPPAAGQTTLPANYQSGLASVIAANWH